MGEAKRRKRLDPNYGKPRESTLKGLELNYGEPQELIPLGALGAALHTHLGRGAIVFELGQAPWYFSAAKARATRVGNARILVDILIEGYDPSTEYVLLDTTNPLTDATIYDIDDPEQPRASLFSDLESAIQEIVRYNRERAASAARRWKSQHLRGIESRSFKPQSQILQMNGKTQATASSFPD